MSSSTGQSASPWASSSTSSHAGLSTSLTDTFGQSRTHYQPGYMMSAQQYNVMPQNTQHTDEIPTVQTKAKMNLALTRGNAPHFGSDSMFESSSGQRQAFTDMDAPPKASINDVFGDSNFGMSAAPQRPFSLALDSPNFSSTSRAPRVEPNSSSPPVYVIVFGYPPDKYSVTVEYFKSLGSTTDPEPNTEIVNCFRIGYRDAAEAMRAVRRNGEVLSGTYMIGVKWADSAAAADLVSPSRSSEFAITAVSSSLPQSLPRTVDGPPPAPTVGTPIRLAPSTAAFRKPGTPSSVPPAQKPVAPIPVTGSAGQSPAKGVIGQVSDLLFGW
ncbi:hypothetical protein V8B97DRAFT_2006226 [Scleroderma yunnanense]